MKLHAKTTAGFLKPAIAFYAAHGIVVERVMTDGPAYVSIAHAIACRALLPAPDKRQGREIIRTTLGGWAYGAICRDSAQRTAALSGWRPSITGVDRTALSVTGRPGLGSPS